ncbi:tetratricopeptide repeat protein [Cyanobium sp. N5-Cardenillas]|uniref:tetratricopeptide repeat protein n=1 Tax=Cyanobium sp. N5-Cardenillas TaxID=2823720 RepID=UPI0020CC2D44|nr:tetratricopeptide repeat protein [Cyanobium sp. N5-Cardenillas]MCP9785823.1 tetratricopeptide repeat protein [Cyanobium sp. N5-Cardenillas]
MPIQRPSEREQRASALEVFTDREELIAAFERNLEHKKPEEHRVLVFYGDGGIGKTTLLQKLEQLHRQRCPQALMGRLDLAGADTTPPDLLLYRLRRLFPNIPFPCFSLALAEYGRRFHPEQVYGSDRNELLQGAGPYADVLAQGLDALERISGVGLAVAGMKALAKGHQQVSNWVQRRAEPLLQRSQSSSEEQLLAQLPLHWARDFRQALASHLGQDWNDPTTSSQDWDDAINYSGPPPLIALDTYETLWHAGMGRSGRRREPRERWLVDLVSELPEVLWVIGGRDRLSWEEGYDRGWSEACEQHLVGQLSDEDARSFLAKRGIVEPAIVEKILRQAAGVPFYLELETQLYDQTPAEERTPEVFGGSQQEQIDRLLTHLDASERATLKLMAAFGLWDRELFRQAVTHFATGYPATGAAELGRFWSIEPVGEGRWQLHNEMAHHLQADERQRDPTTFEAVHRWGFAYFDGPLEVLETKAIQAKDAERLQRALRHARWIQPAAEWATWLSDRLVQLGKGTIWQPLLAVAEKGVQEAELRLGANDPAIAALLDQQAILLLDIAQYGEAEPLFRRALAIDEASYGPDHPDVARDLNNMGLLLQATNRLEEAEPLMRRALAIDEASYGPDHPDVAIVLNNLALLLKATNRLAEAEPMYRRSLAIGEASYGPDHPDVATRLNNLAMLLKATNRLAEAEPLMRRALAIDEASFGPDHPDVARDLNNLALLLKATNRLAEAEPMYRRALAIDEASYGPDHPDVAIDLNNLAMLLQATNRMAEAEPLFRRALAIDEASYGPDHPDVATRLNNLALLLKDTNRLAEAEPLMRRALAIDEASNGPDHPNVAISLNNLAKLLQATDRLAEAETLSARAVRIFLASRGIDHPQTQKIKSNYLKVLQEQGLPEAEIQLKLNALDGYGIG